MTEIGAKANNREEWAAVIKEAKVHRGVSTKIFSVCMKKGLEPNCNHFI
jgi:hypothetical protein